MSRRWSGSPLLTAIFLCGLLLTLACPATAGQPIILQIRPSVTDPAITRFNAPNYVVFDRVADPQAQLIVFMPGTRDKPGNAAKLLELAANQGYRVIGLEYDNDPAVAEVCPRNPSVTCSADFRQKRTFGDDVTAIIDDTPAESIVNRLVKQLEYLSQHDDKDLWSGYIANGEPNWGHIVVAGFSQGAGMAAYIAKRKAVARVVLFSGPWDFQASSGDLAAWIFQPGATSPERWFAEYHHRENTARLIARAYAALRIPPGNISVLDGDLPDDSMRKGLNPFHVSTVLALQYTPQWISLFGSSARQ